MNCDYQKIRLALEYLLENGHVSDDGGICHNVQIVLQIKEIGFDLTPLFKCLDQLFIGWEHHSGVADYPIPVPYHYSHYRDPKTYYYNSPYSKWEGEDLDMRMSLIKYSLKKLEELVNEK